MFRLESQTENILGLKIQKLTIGDQDTKDEKDAKDEQDPKDDLADKALVADSLLCKFGRVHPDVLQMIYYITYIYN